MNDTIQSFSDHVHQNLLLQLRLKSKEPYNPVIVDRLPQPWRCLGAGNYAAVFAHPNYPDQVVKVYAPGRSGIEDEIEVYRRLKVHPAFSECHYGGPNFLVLRRLHGTTLYDCMHQGKLIPPQVIQDIDDALDYARSQGLFPHDVHGRNVMMREGRGLVVDVSDFLHRSPCFAWPDLKRAYRWVYRPIFWHLRLRVPYFLLDGVRSGYRLFRRLWRRGEKA